VYFIPTCFECLSCSSHCTGSLRLTLINLYMYTDEYISGFRFAFLSSILVEERRGGGGQPLKSSLSSYVTCRLFVNRIVVILVCELKVVVVKRA
jgi:hypothetical protein